MRVHAIDTYTEAVVERIAKIKSSQGPLIETVAKKIFDSLNAGGVWNLFGSGHSHMVVEEAFHRAGGLIPVNPWLEEYLMPHSSPARGGPLERLPGLARVIFDIYKPKSGEVLTIISNSGINNTSVEMAQIAKNEKLVTVAITNLEHSRQTTSRNADQKKLFEICDHVIDTGGVKGDAVVTLPHLDVPVGPLSGILGSYIVNSLVVRVCELYAEAGKSAPVYLSANVPGGDERYRKLEELYRPRIKRL